MHKQMKVQILHCIKRKTNLTINTPIKDRYKITNARINALSHKKLPI